MKLLTKQQKISYLYADLAIRYFLKNSVDCHHIFKFKILALFTNKIKTAKIRRIIRFYKNGVNQEISINILASGNTVRMCVQKSNSQGSPPHGYFAIGVRLLYLI